MKRFIIVFLLAIVIFCSCKESSNDVVEEKFPLEFRLANVRSDLPESKSSAVSSADSSLNRFGVVYYLVFDATGKFVRQKKQLKGDPSFGIITDELKAGQYTFVFLSCTGEMTVGTALSSLASTKVKSRAESGDIYYKKLNLNVTSQNSSQNVVSERLIGCVQVKVMDKLADNVAKVELQVENETPYFNLSTDLVETANTETRVATAEVTAANRSSFMLGLLVLNDQAPMVANVTLLDASNNVIKTKRFTGIQNARGKKVSIEGKMSDFISSGFGLRYNDTWAPDSTVIVF